MIIPTDFAQMTVFWGLNIASDEMLTVFGVDFSSYAASPDTAASVTATNIDESFLQALPDNVNINRIEVLTGEDFVGLWEGTFYGELDLPIAPPNVTHLATKRTGIAGREHQGRMYIPAVAETKVDAAGVLDPVYRADLQTACDNFLDKMLADDLPVFLLHNNALTAPDQVTSLQVQQKVATQRRRLR